MRVRRSLAALLVALVAVAGVPASALADADPASDLLPTLDYYLPYSPKVDAKTAAELEGLLAASKKKGTAFKVAVIETPIDLGAITALFHHPDTYAKYLYQEIKTFVDGENGTLLVVMPGKPGVAAIGKLATPKVNAALAKIAFPANATSTDLAQGAIAAMHTVASLNGRTLPSTPGAGGGGGTSSATILIIVVVVAIALAGIGLILRGRRGPPAPASGAA